VSFNHEPDPAYRCFRSSTAISAATSSGASSSTAALRVWLATDFRLELLPPYVDVPRVTWSHGQPGLPRRLVLERHIGEHIRTVLRLGSASIDPKTPLRSLGFDSLLSVELRTRLETSLSVGLDNDFVWTHPTR
jgi:Phosphopantetheine attachment site